MSGTFFPNRHKWLFQVHFVVCSHKVYTQSTDTVSRGCLVVEGSTKHHGMMEDVVGMTVLGVVGVLLVSSGPVHGIPSVGSVVGRMVSS